jgi:peptidoglycan hydrolase-like protein with peptidoglycan-binding domain
MAKYEHNSETFGYLNLEDLDGVQHALAKLGFDPGKVDGKDGPNTQKAVRAFQAHATIGIDGIVGPETRQALMNELAARSATTPKAPASA